MEFNAEQLKRAILYWVTDAKENPEQFDGYDTTDSNVYAEDVTKYLVDIMEAQK